MITNDKADNLILADGHVHIYDCFDLPRLLDAAYRNFYREAVRRRSEGRFRAVLLLSERAGENYFAELCRQAGNDQPLSGGDAGTWHIEPTGESCSLSLRSDSGQQLLLIAGRQLVSRENLEVLALLTERSFADGAPITDLIGEINECGAVAVAPWGVGKWLGKRGKVVDSLLTGENRARLCLGDIGGRPALWPTPVAFKKAGQNGFRVLPGTDPLPLPGEDSRCGSFGFALSGTLSSEYPARDFRQLLELDANRIAPYGRLEYALRFVRNQLQLRLRRPNNHS